MTFVRLTCFSWHSFYRHIRCLPMYGPPSCSTLSNVHNTTSSLDVRALAWSNNPRRSFVPHASSYDVRPTDTLCIYLHMVLHYVWPLLTYKHDRLSLNVCSSNPWHLFARCASPDIRSLPTYSPRWLFHQNPHNSKVQLILFEFMGAC